MANPTVTVTAPAKPTAPAPAAPEPARPAGRPKGSKPEGTPQQRAVKNLQRGLDLACKYVHDGQSSLARRVKTAARAGVPRETVDKAIRAVDEARADLQAVVDASYSAHAVKTGVPDSRVKLG